MVKRSLDIGPPAEVPKRQRQCCDEDSTELKAATQTDHAALRRVQEFLCTAGISCTPGVLRDTTNGQALAQVPAQAWYGCVVNVFLSKERCLWAPTLGHFWQQYWSHHLCSRWFDEAVPESCTACWTALALLTVSVHVMNASVAGSRVGAD